MESHTPYKGEKPPGWQRKPGEPPLAQARPRAPTPAPHPAPKSAGHDGTRKRTRNSSRGTPDAINCPDRTCCVRSCVPHCMACRVTTKLLGGCGLVVAPVICLCEYAISLSCAEPRQGQYFIHLTCAEVRVPCMSSIGSVCMCRPARSGMDPLATTLACHLPYGAKLSDWCLPYDFHHHASNHRGFCPASCTRCALRPPPFQPHGERGLEHRPHTYMSPISAHTPNCRHSHSCHSPWPRLYLRRLPHLQRTSWRRWKGSPHGNQPMHKHSCAYALQVLPGRHLHLILRRIPQKVNANDCRTCMRRRPPARPPQRP